MPRIRSIKPDFFIDENIGELKPLARLCFIGLWCLADREGRLEDKPKQINVRLFPYDNIDIDKILSELSEKFIRRYEVEGKKYIEIINFLKHQKPHHTEKSSEIPEFNGVLTVKEPLPSGEKRKERLSVNGYLLHGNSPEVEFDKLWEKYPSKDGRKAALAHFLASVKNEEDLASISKALENYLKSERVLKGFIKNGSTWFNNWKDWINAPQTPAHLAPVSENGLQEYFEKKYGGKP